MSIFLPVRTKDLPPLEPDSDDDNDEEGGLLKTPMKSKFEPKRVDELSPLAESDDETRVNRFNHAILDESFIFSPVNSPIASNKCDNNNKENNKNVLNEILFDLIDFEKLSLKEESSKQLNDANNDEKMKQKEPVNALTLNQEVKESINNGTSSQLSVFNQMKLKTCSISTSSSNSTNSSGIDTVMPLIRINSLPIPESSLVTNDELETISRRKSEVLPICSDQKMETMETQCSDIKEILPNPAVDVSSNETPFKTAMSHFITPLHFKSTIQPSIHSKRFKSITTSHTKLRNINKEEFESSKVLFRTPYAASRIPITPLPSDSSILLSFNDDSIKNSSDGSTLTPTPTETSEKQLLSIKKVKRKSSKNLFGEDIAIKELENKPDKLNSNEDYDSDGKNEDDFDVKEVIVINGKEYLLSQKLGCGGSSSVYLAKHKTTKTLCAIKIVDLKGDRAIVEGYLNETKLLAKLQGNINIVALYEYEHLSDKSILYMVMEKGDSDLHKVLQNYNTDLPLHVLMNFWHQILQAVNYIHENGVIHSDLKPSNFLMVNGRLKLIDFGIASNISVDATSIIKYSQAGTFNYISPEALIDTSTGNSPINKGQPKIKISTKSDIWSLGCILYLLLYKKTPFGHIKNIYAKVNVITSPETKIDYPELPYYYPQMLLKMVQDCLKHNPKERLSAAELLKYPFHMIIPIEQSSRLHRSDGQR